MFSPSITKEVFAVKLKVLCVEPMRKPVVKEIESGLSSLQHEVGGLIEAVYPFEDPVAIILDEEGKLKNYPYNRILWDENHRFRDILCGTFLVVGLGTEDFCSLSDEMIAKYSEFFKVPEYFFVDESGIKVLPMIGLA
jgi:hypothetical protein